MAKASEMSKAGYTHVKVCAGCGEKLVLTGPHALWFETSAEGARGFHAACYPRKGLAG